MCLAERSHAAVWLLMIRKVPGCCFYEHHLIIYLHESFHPKEDRGVATLMLALAERWTLFGRYIWRGFDVMPSYPTSVIDVRV